MMTKKTQIKLLTLTGSLSLMGLIACSDAVEQYDRSSPAQAQSEFTPMGDEVFKLLDATQDKDLDQNSEAEETRKKRLRANTAPIIYKDKDGLPSMGGINFATTYEEASERFNKPIGHFVHNGAPMYDFGASVTWNKQVPNLPFETMITSQYRGPLLLWGNKKVYIGDRLEKDRELFPQDGEAVGNALARRLYNYFEKGDLNSDYDCLKEKDCDARQYPQVFSIYLPKMTLVFAHENKTLIRIIQKSRLALGGLRTSFDITDGKFVDVNEKGKYVSLGDSWEKILTHLKDSQKEPQVLVSTNDLVIKFDELTFAFKRTRFEREDRTLEKSDTLHSISIGSQHGGYLMSQEKYILTKRKNDQEIEFYTDESSPQDTREELAKSMGRLEGLIAVLKSQKSETAQDARLSEIEKKNEEILKKNQQVLGTEAFEKLYQAGKESKAETPQEDELLEAIEKKHQEVLALDEKTSQYLNLGQAHFSKADTLNFTKAIERFLISELKKDSHPKSFIFSNTSGTSYDFRLGNLISLNIVSYTPMAVDSPDAGFSKTVTVYINNEMTNEKGPQIVSIYSTRKKDPFNAVSYPALSQVQKPDASGVFTSLGGFTLGQRIEILNADPEREEARLALRNRLYPNGASIRVDYDPDGYFSFTKDKTSLLPAHEEADVLIDAQAERFALLSVPKESAPGKVENVVYGVAVTNGAGVSGLCGTDVVAKPGESSTRFFTEVYQAYKKQNPESDFENCAVQVSASDGTGKLAALYFHNNHAHVSFDSKNEIVEIFIYANPDQTLPNPSEAQ